VARWIDCDEINGKKENKENCSKITILGTCPEYQDSKMEEVNSRQNNVSLGTMTLGCDVSLLWISLAANLHLPLSIPPTG